MSIARIMRDQKGIAMPLVLMVLVVLILLGISLYHYSISELDHSIREEKRARAYYIARAGTEALARHIMMDMDILDEIPEEDDSLVFDEQDFDTEFFGENEIVGEVVVELRRISPTRVEVTGTGTVDDTITQSVTIILAIQDEFDGVVYSYNNLKFHDGVEVTGAIVTDGDSVKFGNDEVVYDEELGAYTHPDDNMGIIKKGEYIAFPKVEFPDPPDEYSGTLRISAHSNVDLLEYTIDTDNTPANDNRGYEKILIEKHGSDEGLLKIKAGPGPVQVETRDLEMDNDAKLELHTSTDNHLKLIIENTADIKEVTVSGDGIAEIYIRDGGHLNFQNPHADIIEEGSNLVVYLGEGSTMNLQADGPESYFTGLVYGPEASVHMGGNASFEGSMIVNELTGTGNSNYIGSGKTGIDYKYTWDLLDIDYGGYYMVRWVN